MELAPLQLRSGDGLEVPVQSPRGDAAPNIAGVLIMMTVTAAGLNVGRSGTPDPPPVARRVNAADAGNDNHVVEGGLSAIALVGRQRTMSERRCQRHRLPMVFA